MKKVIFAVLVVVALSLVLVTPALADKGGVPNDDAAWGQIISDMAIGEGIHLGPIASANAPLAWGQGGIPGWHGITHGPELPP